MDSRVSRSALVLAVALLASSAGCGLSLPEGFFGCDPDDPDSCPAGWFCGADFRCYSSADGGGDVDVPPTDDGETADEADGGDEDIPAETDDSAADDGDASDEGDAGDDGDADDGGCDPAACDDGNACNGAEVCTIDGACVATRPPDEGTACERPAGPGHVVPGHCFMELCRPDTCGNSVTDSGEDCDDGNLVNGDGCDADCTFSCSFSDECDDGNACNGTEGCTGHRCMPGLEQPDGATCGTSLVCIGALCVPSGCGDGVTDPATGEECDDGNDTTGDGCDPTCTWSCHAEADCSDLQLCNGAELCNLATHVCEVGTRAADGTPCLRTGGEPGTCRLGTCAGLDCGNAVVDTGEECDDGNDTTGDGCEANCLWSCHSDTDCSDRRTCNGAETCSPTEHRCLAGTPPLDGTECDRDGDPGTREVCLAGSCALSICGDGYADAVRGEECDDGNAVAADGCEPTTCTYSCRASSDCDDGEECNGTETCDLGSHACAPGTPLADGTECFMIGGEAGVCRFGGCTRRACGNGLLDPGEECDDGNLVDGDGCDAACSFSCHASAECHEVPDDPCTTDTCETVPAGQQCRRAFSTDVCDDADVCTAGDVCNGAGLCLGSLVDADGDTYGPGATCGADCNDGAAGVHPGATELCNAIDDDCSGAKDDGAGMTCTWDTSRSCLASGSGSTTCVGIEACTASCVWSGICAVTATETCNAADDDCDGSTDEGFACVLGGTGTCTTACGVAGTRICGLGCTWGTCRAAAEVACNGCDDDGDGVTDEGTWCTVTGLPSTGDFFAIHGTAANDAWIVGASGLILHWNGTSWSSVTSGTTLSLRSVWAVSSSVAWSVGDSGRIVYWNGTSWAIQTSGTTSNLRAVWASSSANAWAAGDGGRMLHFITTSWNFATSGTTRNVRALWGSAPADVFAAGDSQTIRGWNGTVWLNRNNNAPNEDFYALAGNTSTDVWVGGTGGVVARWNGTQWNTSTSPGDDFSGLGSLGTSDAWYVGRGGICGRWNGTLWTATTSGTTRDLYGVWGASAHEVWVVGAAGTLLRWRE
jgi:cysteine-rich repeat protein